MGSPAIIAQDNCAHSARYFGRYGDVVYRCAIRFTAACWCFLFLMLLNVVPANAQVTTPPQQGWAGIVPGSNDYSDPVAYADPVVACQSMQNSFVPAFGFDVFGLISSGPQADEINPNTGVPTAAYGCLMDAGPNGYANVVSLYGCDSSTKLIEGACVPSFYPATAEPPCDGGPVNWKGACPEVGDPISVATGAKVETVTDYTSGGAYPIEVKRLYRSLLMPLSGNGDGLGLAWRSNLAGRRLEVDQPLYNVVVRREDGMRRRFVRQYALSDPYGGQQAGEYAYFTLQQSGGSYWGKADQEDRVKYLGGGVYEYIDEHDRVDRFENVSGASPTYSHIYQLTQTTWRGGYQRNYTYDPNDPNHLTEISDSLGRVIYFTWTGNQITAIDLPDGNKIEYTYEPKLEGGIPVPDTEVLTQVARYAADDSLIDAIAYQYDRSSVSTTVPLLTGMIDAAGVQVDRTTYDPIGRVLTAQGPNGANAVTITYDDASPLIGYRTVTNALGQIEIYEVVRERSRSDVTPSLPKVYAVERVANATVPAAFKEVIPDPMTDNLGIEIDWNGNETETVNQITNSNLRHVDPMQIIEDRNGVQRSFDLTWESDFKALSQVVGPNLTVNYSYDAAQRMTRREEVDTSGNSSLIRAWDYTYNALGLLESVTGPRTDITQTTSYSYDAAGNLATVTNALGQITTVNTVDAAGRPTSTTDVNGVVTSMTYDPLGRVETVTVEGPVDAITTFAYDVNGQLVSTTSPEGVTLTYQYDDAHRLVGITDSSGNSIEYTLDGLGNRVQTQIVDGSAQVLMTNSATFDSLGRLLENLGAYGQSTAYQYDDNGNMVQLVDPRSAVTASAYDGLNRLIQTTDALSGVTSLTYNQQDNLTSVTDARTNATTYEVNGFGFVTKAISPDNGTTTFTHDLAGNILTSKDARRVTTTYTYDALDRPLTRSYGSGAPENVTYVYDETVNGNHGVGQLTSMTDETGSASFTYDAYGNQVSETRIIAGSSYTTDYGYDLDGQLTQIVYPSGLSVVYQHDTLGHVVGITMQLNGASPVEVLAANGTYLPFGPLESLTLGNGVQLTRGFNLDYRLTSLQASGATTVQNLAFAYDDAGNIDTIDDALMPSLDQAFAYDLLGRVTQGTGVYGQDNYSYDAVGNRLTRSLVNGGTTSTTYSYAGDSNQLLSATIGGSSTAYSHASDGSRIRAKTGSGKNAVTIDYGYNDAARLSSVGTASYQYNGMGERAVKADAVGGTHFLFGPDGQLLAEHTAQGVLVRNFIYLDGQPFAIVDGTGSVSYILNDHIGQPQKMLDATGNVTWHRVAGIFGDTVSQIAGSTGSNPLRFPGQQFDPVSALHYNYFRDYDPATGRYIETDPIGINGGINLYNYANGNPLIYSDPDGRNPLLALCAAGAVGGGLGAVIAQTAAGAYDVSDIAVSAAAGCISGAAAPRIALGAGALLVAGGVGAGQYALSNYLNCEDITFEGLAVSAILGGVGSKLSPQFKKPNWIYDTANPVVDAAANNFEVSQANITVSNVIRSSWVNAFLSFGSD